MESKSLSKAILKTLSYADIFNYPLKEEEIWRYLIEEKATQNQVSDCLKNLTDKNKVSKSSNFFFLRGREKIVAEREKKEKLSKQKIKRAKFAAQIIALIPSVKLIGLTGALAMANSEKNDDIDFLIITSSNLLWTTRFLATVILTILGLKRGRTAKKITDKICLNMFFDETALAFSDQNFFIAHEIIQLKPLFERDNTYHRFLVKNSWIFKFLPNWPSPGFEDAFKNQQSIPNLNLLLRLIEKILKKLQLFYMYPHITTEKISDKILKFHPQDISFEVLSKYEKKVKSLKTS